MAASTAFFSSILNISTSKITNSHSSFNQIRFWVQKRQSFAPPIPISICDGCPSSSGSCNSTAISNSLTLDHDSINDEDVKKAESILGSKVRVKVPLKVYHVPKVPELDLTGRVGFLKQYVGVHKGKRISANLPYKVEFEAEEISGRGGKPVKFLAHLREDEFEFLD
ncbi:hypothetical protein AAHA92_21989 [Salvia divinorum]|uniref:Ferredoxin thioredoxin reductase alpha chain domain-containing protein n=1 Tax=Salvia divinorum TaxID=28513 RepID=A0ABD1GM77_SALDI